MHIFDYSRVICCLVLIGLMSATNTKTCWPELVGKTADEAVQTIKEESGRMPAMNFFEDVIRCF